MDIMYATREQVQDSLEIFETARASNLVDSKIRAGSRMLEGLLHRRFYPERKVIKFDYPNRTYSAPSDLWLGQHTLISLNGLTSGGIVIPLGSVRLRRFDNLNEPPFTYLQLDLSASAAFQSGVTWQQAIEVDGVFGWNATDTTFLDGQLGGTIDSVSRTFVINPLSGQYGIGIGSILLVESERMIVINRVLSNTSQTSTNPLLDMANNITVTTSNGSVFAPGEVILIDSERMKIVDIVGNILIVKRAWDGSPLSTHIASAPIYALRQCTVVRGALGSTAVGHSINTPVTAHRFPPLVNELGVAESVVLLEQNAGGYARTIGSGASAREIAGKGLEDLRKRAFAAHGYVRSGAV